MATGENKTAMDTKLMRSFSVFIDENGEYELHTWGGTRNKPQFRWYAITKARALKISRRLLDLNFDFKATCAYFGWEAYTGEQYQRWQRIMCAI